MNLTNKAIAKQAISFSAEGLNLKGHLYLPADFNAQEKYPAVIVGGSLTSVKEQMAGTYAEKLAEQGLLALAFDYRNYGESEGQPRQYEDPELKTKDLMAAVTFLQQLSYVKAIGALGICTSGGNIAYLAAEDQRLQAAATIAAWLPDEETLPLLYGSKERLEELRNTGRKAKNRFAETGVNELIPAYHNTDERASHVGPMEYYMDVNRGGGVKEWKNEFSTMSWENWLDFAPMDKAEDIEIPFMMVHSDGCALPQSARKFYEKLNGKKELLWGTGNHFDYYDQTDQVDPSAEHISRFFLAYLK